LNALLEVSRAVRHAPVLEKLEPLWRLLRPPYRWALDPFARGVRLTLGGRPVRVPPELLSTNPDWSRYEYETFAALGTWLEATPRRLTLLDVGCSFGVVTSFALQVCPRAEVFAFDSDLVSLRAVEAVVPAPAHARLRRIAGLLGSEPISGQTLAAAIAATESRLPAIDPRAAITQSRFLCFGEAGADTTPVHQLDALFAGENFPGPVLLKIDVEGAELLVLRGAAELLRRIRPIVLVSIHPQALPKFGQTAADVTGFMTAAGYTTRMLARDHEEHWWCEPASP
jgi:FkbM family methyltransferase